VSETGSPSRLVQGLVEDGLVHRLPSVTDKRMVTLTLTELGKGMAAKVVALEGQLNESIVPLLKDAPLLEARAFLWRFVEGKRAGRALARRMGRANVDEMGAH